MTEIYQQIPSSEETFFETFNKDHDRQVRLLIKDLSRSGTTCVVSSANHELRNHYVREIVSHVFKDPRHSTVVRAPRDRESIVELLSSQIQSIKNPQMKSRETETLWIFEADFGDEVEKFALISKLISQFKASGVSLIVSCTGVVVRSKEFCSWTSRNKINVQDFAIPNEEERNDFLMKADQNGGFYSARELIASLSSEQEVTSSEEVVEPVVVSEAKVLSLHEPKESAGLTSYPKVEVPLDQNRRGAKLNKRTDLGKTKRTKAPGNRLAYFIVAAPLVVLALVASWIMFEKEVRSLYSGLQIESLAALHDSIGSDVSNEPLTQVQLELDSDVGMETGRTTKVTLEESTIRETAETEKKEPGIWDDVAAVSPSESRVDSMDVPEKDVQTKVEPVAKEELFYLQAGAFSNRQNAERFGRIRSGDSMDYSILQKKSGLWSLVLGPLGRSDAEGILEENSSQSLVLVAAREYLTNQ